MRDRQAVIAWNHRLRDLRLSELPPETQTYLEDEVLPTLPPDRPAYVWFDVFDLAEGRFASGG